jgi:hypothetical protein
LWAFLPYLGSPQNFEDPIAWVKVILLFVLLFFGGREGMCFIHCWTYACKPVSLSFPFSSSGSFNWGEQKYPLASRIDQNLS